MRRQSTSKRELEAFRVASHSQPHAALTPEYHQSAAKLEQQRQQSQTGDTAVHLPPDVDRVILHFDVDCFYAQVEELRDPSLAGKPLGITQKHIIVTSNFPARARGVTKLMSTAAARKACPELVLVSGEDLTPFRAASKQIFAVLQRFGTAEKLGLDETFVDVTPEVKRQLAQGWAPGALNWHGHVHSCDVALQAESKWRPMDLRAVAEATGAAAAGPACDLEQQQLVVHAGGLRQPTVLAGVGTQQQRTAPAGAGAQHQQAGALLPAAATGTMPAGWHGEWAEGWEAMLMLGSTIAAEARAAETGFKCSAGVACNKLMAKLASGLHKPDDQTVMPPTVAADFVAPLPVRALSGVGFKLEKELHAMGAFTGADVRSMTRPQLVQRFGERVGAFLYLAARGKDASPVVEKGPPKSITVEDSFRSCTTWEAAACVVGVLAPDLLARLREDADEYGRRPATLTVKWRLRAQGYTRSSASCPMPPAALGVGDDAAAAGLAAAALQLLRRHLAPGPFDLTLINIGATGFSDGPAPGAGMRTITSMLAPAQTQHAQHAQRAQASQQHSLSQPHEAPSTFHAPVPNPGGLPPRVPPAAAAADAASLSRQQRRDYGAAMGASASLLSKRHERALAEHARQAQHMQQAQQGYQNQQHVLEPPQHLLQAQRQLLPGVAPEHPASQRQRQTCGAQGHQDEGFWELEEAGDEGEEEDSRMWDDLQQLHAGVRTAGKRRRLAAASDARSASPAVTPTQVEQAVQLVGKEADVGMSAPNTRRQQPQEERAGSNRVVIHADVDCFYCQVEVLDDPSLAGKPSLHHVVLPAVLRAGWVQVEVLDDPSLAGKPLAVQQFNSGGFVAVSYEARAEGIRCGDGVGAAGRKAIPFLVEMGSMGMEECLRKCPGLQVRPMRTGRYRQVAQQLHQVLRRFALDGQVEKTSYDDFYLEAPTGASASINVDAPGAAAARDALLAGGCAAAPPACLSFAAGAPLAPAAPENSGQQRIHQEQQQKQQHEQEQASQSQHHRDQHQVEQPGQQQAHGQELQARWQRLAPDLQRGTLLAQQLRVVVQRELGLVLSCGVARNKLLARLASPLGKPDGLTVVSDEAALGFVRSVPLLKVPSLRGKFGREVCAALQVDSVAGLLAFPRAELVRRFGPQQGGFLADLPLAQDATPVRERGPQKTLLAERSFPPLATQSAVLAALQPLAEALLGRVLEDGMEHRRVPAKLSVAWRQGYAANPRSRTGALPPAVGAWLAAAARGVPAPGGPSAVQAQQAQQANGRPAEQQAVQVAQAQQAQEEQRVQQAPGWPGEEQQQHAHEAQQALHGLDKQHARRAQQCAPPVEAVAQAALSLLQSVAGGEWQVTRLAVGVVYDDPGASAAGRQAGQRPISGYLRPPPSATQHAQKTQEQPEPAVRDAGQLAGVEMTAQQQSIALHSAAALKATLQPKMEQGESEEGAVAAPVHGEQLASAERSSPGGARAEATALRPSISSLPGVLATDEPRHARLGPSPSRPAVSRAAASYRNAEAVALLQGGAAVLAGAGDGLPAAERDSLAFALRLQREEILAAKQQHSQPLSGSASGGRDGGGGKKRAMPAAASRRAGGGGTSRTGPLDSFFTRRAAG